MSTVSDIARTLGNQIAESGDKAAREAVAQALGVPSVTNDDLLRLNREGRLTLVCYLRDGKHILLDGKLILSIDPAELEWSEDGMQVNAALKVWRPTATP